MADIVNLNRARKAKKRREKELEAAENRMKFGRTKSEKRRDDAERDRQEKSISSHQLGDEKEE